MLGGPTYTYDRTGNGTDRGASVELGNRLTAFDGYLLAYDVEGNLTHKVKQGVDELAPVWNSLGQMTSAWRARCHMASTRSPGACAGFSHSKAAEREEGGASPRRPPPFFPYLSVSLCETAVTTPAPSPAPA